MSEQKIALFIDAENISAKFGKLIIENLESRGEIFIRRIYGNWEKNSLRKWDDVIRHYGLRTIHQIDFNVAKNATDMSLTVDAMDVLYTKQVTTFAIVSNDSDYTPLAVRLREYGIYVIGMGSKESSSSFRHACNEYISLDSLVDEENLHLAVNVEETVIDEKNFDADKKISELEQKIATLESKLALNEMSATFRLTAEENKNSALSNSVAKVKQKISFATPLVKDKEIVPVAEIAAPEILSDIEKNPVIDISVTGIVAIAAPLKSVKTLAPVDDVQTIDAVKKVDEIKPVEPVKKIDAAKPIETTKVDPVKKVSDEIPAVELKLEKKSEIPSQVKPVDKKADKSAQVKPVDKKVDAKIIERDKALNDRFMKCGQNGMRNPKKKMQQIHDALHESAKIHADTNGFVPLNLAGQELKKKNLGFTVQDFGYSLLNEFIGDFPELYELTRSKQRSFRYRCRG